MRIYSLLHISMVTILVAGIGFCARDHYEGVDGKLLVKKFGAPDSQYATEVDVYLSGYRGSKAVVEINTNYQWFFDRSSFHSVPNWCDVSTPSGIYTGFVTDNTLTFTTKGDNTHPFPQGFDLVLRHATDPNRTVTIHVTRGMKDENFDVFDHGAGAFVRAFKTEGKAITVNGNNQKIYFELKTDRKWKLLIRPTGTNRSEYAGLWITPSQFDPPVSVTNVQEGFNITFTSTSTGTVVIELDIKANDSNRYPRTADIELIALDGGTTGLTSITIPLKQLTATACISFLYNNSTPTAYSMADGVITVPALNPNNTANNFSITVQSESNRNWSVAALDPLAPWLLSMTPMSAALDLGTESALADITFTIAPNPSLTQTREATITFTGSYLVLGAPVNDLSQTLKIIQPPKTAVCYSSDLTGYNFTCDEGGAGAYREFSVTANHSWSIESVDGTTTAFAFDRNGIAPDNLSVSNVPQTVRVYPISRNTDVQALSAVYNIVCNGEVKATFTVSQGAFEPRVVVEAHTPLAGTQPHPMWVTFWTNFPAQTVSQVTDWMGVYADNDWFYLGESNGGYRYQIYVWTASSQDTYLDPSHPGNNLTDAPRKGTFAVIPWDSRYGTPYGEVNQDRKWYFDVPNICSVPRAGVTTEKRFTVWGYLGGRQWYATLSASGGVAVFGPNTTKTNANPFWGDIGTDIWISLSLYLTGNRSYTITFTVPGYSFMRRTVTVTQP